MYFTQLDILKTKTVSFSSLYAFASSTDFDYSWLLANNSWLLADSYWINGMKIVNIFER
jgi:hypothetical protein